MRCPKGMIKKRHSKAHGKPGNYRHSLRGHSWCVEGQSRTCRACKLRIQRLSSEKTIWIKTDVYGHVVHQKKEEK